MLLTYDQIINRVYISPDEIGDNINQIKDLAGQNHPVGQAYLGTCYQVGRHSEKDVSKATELYKLSAEQNHPLGQAYLGFWYEQGISVDKDISKAVELYKLSAEQNHPLGQAYLGLCYEKGIGVDKDMSKAVELYFRSAIQNHPLGQTYLGVCYDEGAGADQDMTRAVELYFRASIQNHPLGQAFLGNCYEKGNGVSKDIPRAIELYNKSYRYRSNTFKELIIDVIKKYSYDQLLEIYEISKYYNLEEDSKTIETELKKYQKSDSYIKTAKWLMETDNKCSICYEEINMMGIYITKCLHYFHNNCVKNESRCPLCREELAEINC